MSGLSVSETAQLRALDAGRYTYARPVWLRSLRRRYVSLRRACSWREVIQFCLSRVLFTLSFAAAISVMVAGALVGLWYPLATFGAASALLAAFYAAHVRAGVAMRSPEGARLLAVPTVRGVELSDFSRWSYVDNDKDGALSADAEALVRSALEVLREHNVFAVPGDRRLTRRYREAGFVEGGTVEDLCRASRWACRVHRFRHGARQDGPPSSGLRSDGDRIQHSRSLG